MDKKNIFFGTGVIFLALALYVGFAGAQSFQQPASGSFAVSGSASFSNSYVNYNPSAVNFYGSSANTYWPILGDKDTCQARQDILLQVASGGCQPAVVRSDLLADQNVPVFCQISALQLNPLLDIKEINSISFTGNYPPEIVGSGFHPARAALRTRDRLLGSPVINNIGYVVLVLKRNPNEKELPDFVNVTLRAKISYDAGNAFGVGRTEFRLSPVSSQNAELEKLKQSFWNGRYSVILESMDSNSATVSIYQGDRRITTTRVLKGKTSSEIYLPGFYCSAGLQIAYDGADIADSRARIDVVSDSGTETIDVYKGSTFLDGKCTVVDLDSKSGGFGDIRIRCGSQNLQLSRKPKSDNSRELSDDDLRSEEQEFKNAIIALEAVADSYPAEKDSSAVGMTYGEEALREAWGLARQANVKKKTEERILGKLIDMYPTSEYIEEYKTVLDELKKIDTSKTGASVIVNNNYYTINVLNFVNVADIPSINLLLDNVDSMNDIKRSEKKDITVNNKKVGIRVDSFDGESAKLTAYCMEGSGRNARVSSTGTQIELVLGETREVCGVRVKLNKINGEMVAKIRLLPRVSGTQTETNLTVAIGIEKRAIQLTPDKTIQKIESLNRSIEKWDNIAKKLGKAVSTMKGACFATAGVLTVKSFLSGIDGTALAREQAMTGINGWSKRCENAIATGRIDRTGDGKSFVSVSYKSMTECFNGEKAHIESEINARRDAIKAVNERMKSIESIPGVVVSDSIGGRVIDSEKYRDEYLRQLKSKYSDDNNITNLNKVGEFAPYTTAQLREIDYYKELKKNNRALSGMADANINRIMEDIGASKSNYEDYKNSLGKGGLENPVLVGPNARRSTVVSANAMTLTQTDGSYYLNGQKITLRDGVTIDKGSTHAISVISAGKNYLVVGNKGSGSTFNPRAVYEYSSLNNDITLTNYQRDVVRFMSENYISGFEDARQSSYSNRIRQADLKVRYFETGPDKGLPALVPFDVANGWYVRVDSNLRIGNQIPAYDSSGLPKSWNICNVMDDGAIDSSDHCQKIIEGVNTDNTVLGQSATYSRKLIQNSRQAILEAGRQSGKSVVTINGQPFKAEAAVPNQGVQCQDFMSVDDCKILFNMCDPVICPATRCNLGGQYQVADVIQTGIVGSALLCLPNAREGILIPVCLSGINAGIESLVSIMKSHRDCLTHSLATGQMVGICDEIYSVYLCEFFWRQAAPVANVIIPKLIEFAYGQGARGGGEYLTVAGAWQNAQNSINYFTQTYAVNSLKAFNIRSVEEVGTQFCKAFISAKSPSSFKSLVEPDSPPQFYAYFDSIPYSSATVPATEQYKVFYHIFAGNDAGVSFSVYLKNTDTSRYIYTPSTITVATGFVGKGDYASATRDFTAPEGYKELCVRINGDEKCGFKQVTTDFGLNYLRDKYASEQATQKEITSESQCVSGSSGAGALISPNIQSGIEEFAFPQDYNRGVVRICSSVNPGLTTNPSRYTEVGYCGTKNVKCWLDRESVKNAISDSNIGILNKTLSEVENIEMQRLQKQGEIFGDAEANVLIRDFKERSERLIKSSNANDIINLIKDIDEKFKGKDGTTLGKLYYNHHKAEVMLIKGRLKAALTRISLINNPPNTATSAPASQPSATTRSAATQPTSQPASAPTNSITRVYFTIAGGIEVWGGSSGVKVSDGVNIVVDKTCDIAEVDVVKIDRANENVIHTFRLNKNERYKYYNIWVDGGGLFKAKAWCVVNDARVGDAVESPILGVGVSS